MISESAVIYWCHRTGLANRLRAFVGYQALARVMCVPFYLCWEANYECDAEFTDLFEPRDVTVISGKEKDDLVLAAQATAYDATPYYDVIWETHLGGRMEWNAFRQVALDCLRNLCPVRSIRNQVNSYSRQHDIGRCHGLHVRMTDNVSEYRIWAQYVPSFDPKRISRVEGFERFIDDTVRADPACHFFLATDNYDVEKRLLRAFPGSIITYPKQYRPTTARTISLRRLRIEKKEQRVSPIDQALVELLLLSRCVDIVGTYWSSFSELAAILGNRTHYVVNGDRYGANDYVARLGVCCHGPPLPASIAAHCKPRDGDSRSENRQ